MAMSTVTHLYQALWNRLATIDLRALALLRIGLAISILVNLGSYLYDFQLIFSSDGIFPRSFAVLPDNQFRFSLYFISERVEFAALLFVVNALAAIALLFGYRTRIACFICWLLMLSLNNRLSLFLYLSDTQLLVLLFWGMFLPLNARFSVDSALAKKTVSKENRYTSIACLAILLQETYLYFFGALAKTGESWLSQHNALEYALHAVTEKRSGFIPDLLRQWPEVMEYLTVYVYYVELFAIIFIFSPILTERCRLFIYPQLVALHLGILIFMDVHIFPLISITGLSVLLPTLFWDRLQTVCRRIFKPDAHAIYYDEPCHFCKKVCLIFRSLSVLQSTPIVPAQSDKEIYEILQRENSWVVKTDTNQLLTKWPAVAYLWRRSPLLFPLGWLFKPTFMEPLGQRIYALIANNRSEIANATAPLIPYRPVHVTSSSILRGFVLIFCTALTLFYNIVNTLYFKDATSIPIPWFYQIPQLNQHWAMFAPEPYGTSYWLEVIAVTEKGDKIDPVFKRPWSQELAEADPFYQRDAGDLYPSTRILEYSLYITAEGISQYYAPALCKLWQRKYDTTLSHISFSLVTRKTNLSEPEETWPFKKEKLVSYACQNN